MVNTVVYWGNELMPPAGFLQVGNLILKIGNCCFKPPDSAHVEVF